MDDREWIGMGGRGRGVYVDNEERDDEDEGVASGGRR